MLCVIRCTSHRLTSSIIALRFLRCLQTKPNSYSTPPFNHQLLKPQIPRGHSRRNNCNYRHLSGGIIISSLCCNSGKSIYTSSFTRNNSNPMDLLSVINVPEDDKLKITFDYSYNDLPSRSFNLIRQKDEPLGQSLFRLRANISKYISKKNKKKRRKLKKTNANEDAQEKSDLDDEEEIEISVWRENIKVLESISNVEAWVTGSSLCIDSCSYNIIVNIPTITKLSIPTNLMVGFPVYLQIEYLFTDVTQCNFSWYKDIKASCSDDQQSDSNNGKVRDREESVAWQKLSSSNNICDVVYTPSIDDLGHRLKIVCVPRDTERGINGKEILAQSTAVVDPGPGQCPFQTRHLYTKDLTEDGCFRVVTYNLLADYYVDSDYSRTVLYPYCPPYALSIDYRKQLILKELAGYNADLICLQEVDKKVFENDLLPALSLLGFDGVLRTKAGQVPEGCATFFRKSKFKMVDQHDIFIMEAIQTDPRFEDILQLLKSNEELQQRTLNRQTALQLIVLESLEKSGYFLCAANIHLYFHPTAKSIRLLQTAVCMKQIESLMKMYKDQGKEITFTFCGDFNSSPEFGVHQFLTTGYIPADFQEWKADGNPDGVETGIPLSHSFNLSNGCGSPEYTNYVGGFHAQLDYIYHDPKKLEVLEVVPSPEHKEVILYTALPNVVFPSDHIAQISTFRWR